jgi:hypothetical protein
LIYDIQVIVFINPNPFEMVYVKTEVCGEKYAAGFIHPDYGIIVVKKATHYFSVRFIDVIPEGPQGHRVIYFHL